MSEFSTDKPVVLTCAQPTGRLHLGNYLGAVKNWVRLIDSNDCYFGIVDLHAITTPYTPSELRKNTLNCLAEYIACGLDPERCHIFLQSHVIGHTELAWILGCLTPLGKLERMTQFKDKASKQKDATRGFIGSGLLTYPVLMAADILLYNADRVPVGEDQKQHLELARDIAQKFNETYSPTFKVPNIDIPKNGARIMSLQSPSNKMSKSDANENGTVFICDDAKLIKKKIMSAITDSDPERRIIHAKEDSGVPNLLNIMASFSGKSIQTLEAEFKDVSYADFKQAIAETVCDGLAPIRERYEKIKNDKDYLLQSAKTGAEAAQKRAYKTLSKVYRKAGFLQS